MEYIHIMPKYAAHVSSDSAHCYCEPTVQRLKGVPEVRIVIHQGIKKARVEAELRQVFRAFPDTSNADLW
jgi:hypothetical protein